MIRTRKTVGFYQRVVMVEDGDDHHEENKDQVRKENSGREPIVKKRWSVEFNDGQK